jgi:hypothetical protein
LFFLSLSAHTYNINKKAHAVNASNQMTHKTVYNRRNRREKKIIYKKGQPELIFFVELFCVENSNVQIFYDLLHNQNYYHLFLF